MFPFLVPVAAIHASHHFDRKRIQHNNRRTRLNDIWNLVVLHPMNDGVESPESVCFDMDGPKTRVFMMTHA